MLTVVTTIVAMLTGMRKSMTMMTIMMVVLVVTKLTMMVYVVMTMTTDYEADRDSMIMMTMMIAWGREVLDSHVFFSLSLPFSRSLQFSGCLFSKHWVGARHHLP